MNLEEYRNREKKNVEIIEGALPKAIFDISPKQKVVFSQGNLQFRKWNEHKTLEGTAKGTWRFAKNQYEFIGEKIPNNLAWNGWVDLFGWGTSGWQGRDPWMTSGKDEDYWINGRMLPINSRVSCSFGDWGIYNAISNGGNEPGLWRTLNHNEMIYMMTHNKGWTIGRVIGKWCILLFPDSFPLNQFPYIKPLYTVSWKEENNGSLEFFRYTADFFPQLEELGVVALPFSGYCFEGKIFEVGASGSVWLSSINGPTENGPYCPQDLYYTKSQVYWAYSYKRSDCRSVRLVHDL